jgi:hypothetical protein
LISIFNPARDFKAFSKDFFPVHFINSSSVIERRESHKPVLFSSGVMDGSDLLHNSFKCNTPVSICLHIPDEGQLQVALAILGEVNVHSIESYSKIILCSSSII